METARHENRQGDERRAVSARDDIGRRRELAHVEFDLAHHAPKGADLRLDRDELGVHALDRGWSRS